MSESGKPRTSGRRAVTYEVSEITSPGSRRIVGIGETLEEAKALIAVLFIEEDEHNPGCFDVLGKFGQIYAIERRA